MTVDAPYTDWKELFGLYQDIEALVERLAWCETVGFTRLPALFTTLDGEESAGFEWKQVDVVDRDEFRKKVQGAT